MALTKEVKKPVAKPEKPQKPKRGKPRNYKLADGLYKFSKTKMFHKTARYKFIGKKNAKVEKPKRPSSIEKPIGGEKNGGTRIVLLKKRKNFYPTSKKINKHPSKTCFRKQKRYTRPSLQPGTICILLAGAHKGKRVVLLKVLNSGLLLVTGPFELNGCPMRRISQNFVIATRTRLDLTGVDLPAKLTDDYFKRKKQKRTKKEDGDVFAAKKEVYKASDERKADQKIVDKSILSVIKKHTDKPILVRYLKCLFSLRSSQYPHRLKF